MKMRITLALFLLPAFATPAHAADLATIDCVIGKLPPALREQIEETITSNFAETALRPKYEPAVDSGVRIAAIACAGENKWSDAATTAARAYTLAKIAQPIAEKFVTEKGFEPAELETQFSELPEETRNLPLSTTDMQNLVIASVTDEAKQTRENAMLLNRYFLYLSGVQAAAWDFSQA